jgi:hypothetical protein
VLNYSTNGALHNNTTFGIILNLTTADSLVGIIGSELFENCCNESVEIEVVFWICIIYDAKLLDIKDKTKKVNSLCKDFFLIKMLNALVF